MGIKKFEDCIDEIDKEIFKRKGKWTLTAISWFDFDDVSQILRIHIHKKWSQYNQERPLAPWLNALITSQIKNILRNIYGNFCRPCLKCAASEGTDGCKIYQKQCNECPLYSNWESKKKSAHDTKLPVSIENHTQEIFNRPSNDFNIEKAIVNMHEKMKGLLKSNELKLYEHLYIENKSEEEAAALMGYKSNEPNRKAGYRQIKNIQNKIIEKAREILLNEEIDLF